MNSKAIGVIILTLNGESHLHRLLPPLLNSFLKPRILIIDSKSTDNTVSIARKQGVEVIEIERKDFNHGLTRELGRKFLKTDICVFLTQDAYLVDNNALGLLVDPIINKKASLSYARQIPRPNAGILESFPREFNYPEISHIRSIKEIDRYGVYTFFTSNSCAAYSNVALNEIGGFSKVLFGEDTLACAKLLHRGHKIAYVAECRAEHSHDFSLKEEYHRNYAIGKSRKLIAPYLEACGKDSVRGKAFVKALMNKLLRKAPWLIPYACMQILIKYLGYSRGAKSC